MFCLVPPKLSFNMIIIILGAAIQFSTVLAGVLACCIQSVFKKSVISLAGATQALGGNVIEYILKIFCTYSLHTHFLLEQKKSFALEFMQLNIYKNQMIK